MGPAGNQGDSDENQLHRGAPAWTVEIVDFPGPLTERVDGGLGTFVHLPFIYTVVGNLATPPSREKLNTQRRLSGPAAEHTH
jgi:hypothetical protein